MLSFRLQQCFNPFAMLSVQGSSKHGFSDIYLTIFFGDGISENTSAMRTIFFGKCLKFNINYKNAKKKLRKVFVFEINAS